MGHSFRTLILIGLGIVIVGGLAYLSFREDPVAVDLHTIGRGPFQVTINADGETKVRDLYEIASPIAGTALRSPVEVGDAVVAGQTVVAVVEPVAPSLLDRRTRLQAEATLQEATAALQVAQADLVSAQEDRIFAQTQFDRVEALLERNVASLTQLEDASQRLAIANASVAAAEARIDMAKGTIDRARASLMDPDFGDDAANGCCVEITSPADGVVLSINTISQRPVAVGEPLLTVGDPTDLELVADLLSNDGVRLSPGAVAYVDRWGGPDPLIAELDRIDPIARTKVSALGIEEQRVDAYFNLTTPVDQRPGLGDSFSVFLRIVEWQSDDTLQVPLSALFRQGDDWAVFVEAGGMAELRPVVIHRRNMEMAVVLDGLAPGDRVVTHPSDAVRRGVSLIDRSTL
ncbi:efflux RND transporter periplasmic adaptor subunit [Pseudaestuariivita rosea]|uniref:efflux RND transporter periplasmic adaptor subunit n=1 Tax=Pseudaestuariivita rosea TaxID=2763263 RepID=UPI001ABBAB2D|nr:HlyD family efflux transporter periplasmic adaptor subunit [Pseudaestuariivita rosea]